MTALQEIIFEKSQFDYITDNIKLECVDFVAGIRSRKKYKGTLHWTVVSNIDAL